MNTNVATDSVGSRGSPPRMRTDRQLSVVILIIAFAVVCIWISSRDASARYVIYLLPVLIVLSAGLINRGRMAFDRNSFLALLLFLTVAVVSMLSSAQFDGFAIRDVVTISCYLLMFTVCFSGHRQMADVSFAILVAGLALVAASQGINTEWAALQSVGVLESTLAFPLGVIVLFYFHERKWWRFLLACFVLFLTFKRITLLGVCAIAALEFASLVVFRRPFSRRVAIFAVISVSVCALFLTEIFEFVSELIADENSSAAALSLGRTEFATAMWDSIDRAAIERELFGFGPGSSVRFLSDLGDVANPHNDWLKVLFDYGFLGFAGFHVILGLIHPDTPLGNKLYVFTAILMVTDNVLIYIHYFAFVFLVCRIDQTRKQKGGSHVL